AGVAGVALVKAKRNEQTADKARADAEEATKREKESLRAETYAKTEAQDQKRKAEEEKRIADTQKGIAEKEKVRADDRAADAEQARDAFERKSKESEQAKKANDLFREAAINVQRGKFKNADHYFTEAITEFKNPLINNQEGVADATVEIGNLALTVGRQTFAVMKNFRFNDVMKNLDLGIKYYDE